MIRAVEPPPEIHLVLPEIVLEIPDLVLPTGLRTPPEPPLESIPELLLEKEDETRTALTRKAKVGPEPQLGGLIW